MAEITSGMVSELRKQTGAGLMDCKRALEATGGELESAVDHLRKQGLKSAEKKSDRAMGEGRVQATVADDRRSGAAVAVTCETDFVARTPDFDALIDNLVAHVAESSPASVEAMLDQTWKPTGTTVAEAIKATIGKLGENIQLARVQAYQNPEGRVGSYVHHNQKVGVLVSVTTGADGDTADETIRSLCMHIAAMKPTAARREDVPAADVERERAIYLDEVKDKPEEMREKIVKGKLEKYFADAILPEQKWFKDDSKTVQKALEEALGDGTRIDAFVRFEVGG